MLRSNAVMKKLYLTSYPSGLLSICLLLLALAASAQVSIKGVVTNRSDHRSISNASVYVNNSSIGTTTDENGNFDLTIYGAVTELIVSHVGFEKQSLTIDLHSFKGNLDIELKPRADLMNNVTIQIKNKENWKKWGKLFTDYFIGELEFAKKCRILNPEVIRFSYNKNMQTVIARARKPILVENRALGYIVHFDMDSFSYSFQSNQIFRAGSIFFENIAAKDSTEAEQFAANRLYAYRGSKMHFMRSIVAGNFSDEGFKVYVFKAKTNLEKLRIQKLMNEKEARNYEQGRRPEQLQVSDISTNKDTIAYYSDVMASPAYVFYDSVKLQLDERITKEQGAAAVLFHFNEDTFLVNFRDKIESSLNADPVKRAKHYKRLPSELKRNYDFFREYKPSRQQFTILYLLKGTEITIEQNGYYHEINSLFEDGYMAWKKVAHLLPWDYDPQKDTQIVDY
jgi:hypothetical protein